MATDQGECTCPLLNVGTFADPHQVVRGDPTGSGCPLHETIEMRTALWAAEWKARYRPNAWTVLPSEPTAPSVRTWRHCRQCRKSTPTEAARWHRRASRIGLAVAAACALLAIIALTNLIGGLK
jgi:hypothetical protein